ncbi:hypothetical protein P168DRAFT_280615 [Aspergillus campestris IBT 28561]|uniref:Methylated-DNA-[protein]-cysteine S-methyltransferase DNA binding domain-containing protein n=1 Tax=Aspergillus campestris (strain IBT 28561) TaxID=1392248 RepID=A0A2I1D788_ASPC2|nr:uncharacterized protein P168DRAFT_280615 [Aspergillus campestris IBT 28561]PKY05723.1 hypothetical protein P168DRAFT_280615 [Aspergillus campestris IBT 28561]
MGWFPTTRDEDNGWRFDIVSHHGVFIRLLSTAVPAPQTVLKTDRPSRLPSIKDVVIVGVHSGTHLTELNFFADVIHEINQLQPYEFRVFDIKHAHPPPDVSLTNDIEKQPYDRSDTTTTTTTTTTTATEPPDEVIHVPLKRACALNLVIIASVIMTAGLFAWAGSIGDGIAMISIATMSLSTSLACLSSSWKPVLSARPTSAEVPPGDIVISTRNRAMVVVHCTEEITRELYSGTENCRYRLSDRPHRALLGTSTVLLMASVVLFSNCGWTMQTAIGVSYMILNILYWAVPLLMDRRDTWDMSRYVISQRGAAFSPSRPKASFTQTLWYAVQETKRTEWVATGKLAPASPWWDRWLEEALANCENVAWDPVEAKDRWMAMAVQTSKEQMAAAATTRRQTAPALVGDEAEHWFNAVYAAVQEIPRGKVTSYGHIALLLGEPKRPRQVGVCLKHLPGSDSANYFHAGNVPWQRVVNARGMVSHRGPGSAQRQADALRDEGVDVAEDAMGEFSIDLGKFGWFPSVLPSEREEMGVSDVDEIDEMDEGGHS